MTPPPTLLQRIARIWDRNVKAARLAYAQVREQVRGDRPARLETAVARMLEDERRAERAQTAPCRSAK